MTLIQLGLPVISGLAFIGYVACLRHWMWLTLAGTVACALIAFVLQPFGPETWIYWGAAVTGLISALVVARRLTRAPLAPSTVTQSTTTQRSGKKQIVLDGTNILHWDNDGAQMATLRIVVNALKEKRFVPMVFLDASTRHHLGDKSLNEKGFAKALGVPKSQVFVCPAGTEADVFILRYARDKSLPIVSNDRFRNRAAQTKGLRIIKGIIVKGQPIFEGPIA